MFVGFSDKSLKHFVLFLQLISSVASSVARAGARETTSSLIPRVNDHVNKFSNRYLLEFYFPFCVRLSRLLEAVAAKPLRH